MNLDSLNKWLTLAANIGVIAGIIFLGLELQQNNELLEAQTRYNHKETRANNMSAFSNNSELAEIIVKAGSGETLTPKEQLQLESHWNGTFVSFEWEFYEASMGRMELPVEGYKLAFTRPGAMEQWNSIKGVLNQDFVSFIESSVLNY